jgi:hypothetical protein
VEIDIGALEALQIADRLAVRFQRILEILQILACSVERRVAGKPSLEENRGVGLVTRARSPERTSTSPILLRCSNASRTDGRPTPKWRMRSRSDGSRSASAKSPSRIICSR